VKSFIKKSCKKHGSKKKQSNDKSSRVKKSKEHNHDIAEDMQCTSKA